MKRLTVVALAMLAAGAAAVAQQSSLTLWYRQPAVLWVEALPVGNGQLGAMIFGGAAPRAHPVQRADRLDRRAARLRPSRALTNRWLKSASCLWAGKQKEAEDLAMKEFMSEPLHQKAYQAFGDLLLDFPGLDEIRHGYRRSLDLDTGVASVEFTPKRSTSTGATSSPATRPTPSSSGSPPAGPAGISFRGRPEERACQGLALAVLPIGELVHDRAGGRFGASASKPDFWPARGRRERKTARRGIS
jgi:hypothetical protein